MKKITISALGELRKKIVGEETLELETSMTAFELVEKYFDIPKTEPRMAFVVNGKMQKGAYVVDDGDSIKVLKMGGAG
ncbi:MoaD/ThiS family protein [Labilibacter marinus]|uniref:MoaD/ThiS family protein n=1 Tax=Labilibacter marinus TaxID=1477105 RepID=UPI00094F7163|nr:MoaD/ThiS family protein [Labilibacter marinus]